MIVSSTNIVRKNLLMPNHFHLQMRKLRKATNRLRAINQMEYLVQMFGN